MTPSVASSKRPGSTNRSSTAGSNGSLVVTAPRYASSAPRYAASILAFSASRACVAFVVVVDGSVVGTVVVVVLDEVVTASGVVDDGSAEPFPLHPVRR